MSETRLIPLPPFVQSEWQERPPATGPWYKTISLAYGGLFIWAPFFDQIWLLRIGNVDILGLLAVAFTALLFCYYFFYRPLATAGFLYQQRLGVLAASTFGTQGAEWIVGVGLAAAGIVWYAVTFDFAVDATMLGLESMRLLERSAWDHPTLWGGSVRSPVFLLTAGFWIFIIRTAYALGLTSVIVALMKFYSPVALLLLTAIAFAMLGGFLGLRPDDYARLALHEADFGHGSATIVTHIFGFFALAGFFGADWGATARERRDVVLGGITGIIGVGMWVALMSLIIVGSAVHQLAVMPQPPQANVFGPLPLSFRWAILNAVGGPVGGTILILFGLASLAPAVYLIDRFGRTMSAHWPLRKKWLWGWLAGVPAMVMIALGWSQSIGRVEEMMGHLLAPALGALAADMMAQHGACPGVRPGLNRPGLIAVALGLFVWPAWQVLLALNWNLGTQVLSVLYAFLVPFFVYAVAQRQGWMAPTVPLEPFTPQIPTLAELIDPPLATGHQDAP
jgi:hypothetical protein